VSIIVPNYNHAKFLSLRLDSIFNQTFQDYEVILLDDASTDGSIEILNKYSNHEKVTHFVVNEENSGSPFTQWRKGIELAKGELIWIAESDDYAEYNFLETFVKYFISDVNLGIAFTRSIMVDDKDIIIGHSNSGPEYAIFEQDFNLSGKQLIQDYLRFGNCIWNVSSGLIRKNKIQLNGNWTSMRYSGDWYFYLSIFRESNVVYQSEPKSYFRRYSKSHSWREANLKNEFKRINEFKLCANYATSIVGPSIKVDTKRYLWICSHYLQRLGTTWNKTYYILISNLPYSIKIAFIENRLKNGIKFLRRLLKLT
jgi:glycosyltransferase involved in cell wall biosynthesis